MTNMHYTDPLIATYMVREFGVKFEGDMDSAFAIPSTMLNPEWPQDQSWLGSLQYKTSNNNKGYIDYYTLVLATTKREEPYHIHPDSHHIFDPQEGDICSYEQYGPDGGSEVHYVYNIYESQAWNAIGCSIIQRNNKAFFTPEVDE